MERNTYATSTYIATSPDAAFDYFMLHQKRAVLVMGVRALRLWGFYDLEHYTRLEGRPRGLQTAALVAFYPVLIAGIVGAVLLFRRRKRVELRS